jgi:hypothetical protein
MWEQVNKYINISNNRTRHAMICGAVGEGVGTEFESFIKMAHMLPDPDMIIMDPENAKVPTDLSAVYATVGALSVRASPSNFDRILKYGDKLKKEFQVLLVRDSSKRNPEVANTRAFSEWAIKNTEVLI